MGVALSQDRVCSLGPAWACLAWGQTRNPHLLPACQLYGARGGRQSAGRAQAERRQAGQCPGAHRRRLSLPRDLQRWVLAFWLQNGASLLLGFRSWSPCRRTDTSAARLALRTRQEDMGLAGQRRSLDGGSLAGGIWSLGSRWRWDGGSTLLGLLVRRCECMQQGGSYPSGSPDHIQAPPQLGVSHIASLLHCSLHPLPSSRSCRADSQPPSSPWRAALHYQPRPDPAGEERNESKGN